MSLSTALRRQTPWKPLLRRYRPFSTSPEDGPRPPRPPPPPPPPPIRVGFTESAGRGVFATRPIRAGDPIHTAKPLVTHPSPSLLHQVCYFCLKKLGREKSAVSLPIQDGGSVLYESASASTIRETICFCTEKCSEYSKGFYEIERRADWSAFDEHCREQEVKYPLLVKRFACMVLSGASRADALDILQPARLFPQNILEMEEEFRLLKDAFLTARIAYDQMSFLTKDWYVGTLARIRINAFRVEFAGGSYEDLLSMASASVIANAAVGNAVYMLPSFYNHDCDPNAHIIWIDSADAKLKALRDIEEGEELCICYIDASMDHDARKTLLLEGFGFQCCCPRCMADD
ncbi:Histone-lysine N-methyltransferase ATXR4 [Acorus gramineus]|uniref:Histone-lysine N-methyltransferase ATXR4 n=1 Tax=Acorus gramineus TaxID=55184 RepID=A0AAV9A4J2_ACOGR|nr:Histone-lysine N-methyltransferase ATXR4 [Acorus gramineus]